MDNQGELSLQILINRLKNLPALPEASGAILQAVNDPDISIEKLVDVLMLSPALVARLLGLANSAYFGQSNEINELHTAIIQVLGLQLVKSLALGVVLNVQLDAKQCQHFNTEAFWLRSLMTAISAKKLASMLGSSSELGSATAYTGGLLLNIGVLVVAYLFPLQLDGILASEARECSEVAECIKQKLGLSHYQIGYLLLKKWQLPSVYPVLLNNFDRGDLASAEADAVRLLRASSRLCALVLEEGGQTDNSLEFLAEEEQIPLSLISQVFDELNAGRDHIRAMAMAFEA